MKTLFLVRHAKSDWDNNELPDIDRPLNSRGYRDAHFMSTQMRRKELVPDQIITSPAIRAISTALIFCRNFNLPYSNLTIESKLYDTGKTFYMETIQNASDKFSNIMLFGHNPIITNVANSITKPFAENVSTCAIVGVRQLECTEWKKFFDTPAELVFYNYPKNTQ